MEAVAARFDALADDYERKHGVDAAYNEAVYGALLACAGFAEAGAGFAEAGAAGVALDLGCGPGIGGGVLARRFATVWAADVSAKMRALVRARPCYARVFAALADVPPASVRCVAGVFLLHLVPRADGPTFLQQVARALEPCRGRAVFNLYEKGVDGDGWRDAFRGWVAAAGLEAVVDGRAVRFEGGQTRRTMPVFVLRLRDAEEK